MTNTLLKHAVHAATCLVLVSALGFGIACYRAASNDFPHPQPESAVSRGDDANLDQRPAQGERDLVLVDDFDPFERTARGVDKVATDSFPRNAQSGVGNGQHHVPSLAVIGTVIGPGFAKALVAADDVEPRTIQKGDTIRGFTVDRIDRASVVLSGRDTVMVLSMDRHNPR